MKHSAWSLAIPVLGFAMLAPLLAPTTADAARIENTVAEFAGIDKITGRITKFDVYVDETVQFGALQVTPKVCYSRDETEAQKIDAFVEVDEITLDRKIRRIFSGWMFADSPALNAVEHAIYDVWLTGCKATSEVPAPPGAKVTQVAPEPAKPAEAPAPVVDATVPPTSDFGAVTSEEPVPAQAPAPGIVPPLDAPQVVPDEVFGGALPPPDGFPQQGDPIPEGQPLPPTAPVAPPGGVGLY